MASTLVHILHGAAFISQIHLDFGGTNETERAPHGPLAGRNMEFDMLVAFPSSSSKKPGHGAVRLTPRVRRRAERPVGCYRWALKLRPQYSPTLARFHLEPQDGSLR